MNTFVRNALAFTAVGSLGFANSGTDSEWLGLDNEIKSLASSYAPQGGGVDIGALVRSVYESSSDFQTFDAVDGVPEDTGGFRFIDADVWLEGEVGDFDWRVSVDLDEAANSSGSSIAVEDAYATIACTESITSTVGSFKAPWLRSNSVDPENQILIERTKIGSALDFWDHGILVNGDVEQFSWMLVAQNGGDGQADDLLFGGRAELAINNGIPHMEGSYGASEDMNAIVGLMFADDGSYSKGGVFGLDAAITAGPMSGHVEFVSFDEGINPFDPTGLEDGTPYNLTFGYMFVPDEWEAALRYQDDDDAADTTSFTLGVSYYKMAHNAKAQLNFTSQDSDDSSQDGDLIALSLTVGATRR